MNQPWIYMYSPSRYDLRFKKGLFWLLWILWLDHWATVGKRDQLGNCCTGLTRRWGCSKWGDTDGHGKGFNSKYVQNIYFEGIVSRLLLKWDVREELRTTQRLFWFEKWIKSLCYILTKELVSRIAGRVHFFFKHFNMLYGFLWFPMRLWNSWFQGLGFIVFV